MGKRIDRGTLYVLAFGVAFWYFLSTIKGFVPSILFALALCVLIWCMARMVRKSKGTSDAKPPRRRIRLVSRAAAPRLALYGALYMALYLIVGAIVYLPLSLILIFLSVLGFRQRETNTEAA
ncbi:hypothetical protein LJC33_03505 [Eubacteriales bacterium OttesenSCG-928-N13]|nr:hypothetical protein [Eubacteriales bacterium OttesenSCG-928-N13]